MEAHREAVHPSVLEESIVQTVASPAVVVGPTLAHRILPVNQPTVQESLLLQQLRSYDEAPVIPGIEVWLGGQVPLHLPQISNHLAVPNFFINHFEATLLLASDWPGNGATVLALAVTSTTALPCDVDPQTVSASLQQCTVLLHTICTADIPLLCPLDCSLMCRHCLLTRSCKICNHRHEESL